MSEQNQIDWNLVKVITKNHFNLLARCEYICTIHKNYDKLRLKDRFLFVDRAGRRHNHFKAFYITVMQSVKKIKKIPSPHYDISDLQNDSNLLFSDYFHFASDLFFCLYSTLLYFRKHDSSNSQLISKVTDSLVDIQKILRKCVLTISIERRCIQSHRTYQHFGIDPYRLSSKKFQKPLHIDDLWLDIRMQEYEKFLKDGECRKEFLPFELWLFNRYKGSCGMDDNPQLKTMSETIDGLDTFCAYADCETKLKENLNDYIMAYFFDFKKQKSSTQADFIMGNNKEHGHFPFVEFNKEKSSFCSTINNINELCQVLQVNAIINYPINLNNEKTKIIYIDKEKNKEINNLISIINTAFTETTKVNQSSLGSIFTDVFAMDQGLFEQWPCIPFLLYWISHFFEYKKYCKLFLENTNSPKSEIKEFVTTGGVEVKVRTWQRSDLQEIVQKKFIKNALPKLQLIFFFALFDITDDINTSTRKSQQQDEFTIETIETLLYKALSNGTWKESETQTAILNEILSNHSPDSSINADFTNFSTTSFHPTETALFLLHSINSYAREHRHTLLIQMINFIDEQRSKSFNYYHEDFDYLENLDSKKHKQMLKKVKNMEKIDSGFPIHLIQKNPTFENQFFSRRIRCKLFHESDTKISYLDEEEVKFISYNDFYRRLYLNFTNSIYLNEERNMYTHYSKFKYTEKLLKKEYCIDLLLLLYDIKSKKANEPSSWIRLCDKYFALLKDHIAQYKVLDKFAQKLEKDNINNDDRKDALEKIRQLQKGNLSIIDNNGILAIKKNVLKKIGFCVDDYPFEDDLRVVLNTIFGISNICRIKPDKADSIPIKEENIEDDDISFLELYGYESKLYLIKVLIELAEYK